MLRWERAHRYLKSSNFNPWLSVIALTYATDTIIVYNGLAGFSEKSSSVLRVTYAVIGFVEYGSIALMRQALPYELAIVTAVALTYDMSRLKVFDISHANSPSHDLMTCDLLMLVSIARGIGCTLLVCQHFIPKIEWNTIATWFSDVFRVKPFHAKGSQDKDQGLLKVESWWDFIKELSIFLPHVTPRKNPKVQLALVFLAVSILVERVMTIATASQLGIITDKIIALGITEKNELYRPLVLWLMLGLFKGQCGLRTIGQASYDCVRSFMNQNLSRAAFNHVMSLSKSFHDGKDSADVLGAVYEGDALADLLSLIFLEVLPSFVDMALGFAYMYRLFDSKIMIVLLFKASIYILFDIWTSRMRTDNRRQRSKIGRKERSLISQAVSGWSTVAFFGQFEYESQRVADLKSQYEEADVTAKRMYYIQYSFLEALMAASHFSIIQLVLTRIVRGESSAGSLIALLSHWDYMMSPLMRVVRFYQIMQHYSVPVERLATLLRTKPTIVDAPDAYALPAGPGEVRFHNVSFAYDDRKSALSNIDLAAPAGTIVGIVGETGAGKSTIFKLLSRFYDITPSHDTDNKTTSSIKIDGHDVRDITQQSLRSAIGIVPQNSALFNESIRENIRYARTEASDADVEDAARSAMLHYSIMAFPDGYESRVGERGVKLSGGELQRVAIARVFLLLQAKRSGKGDDQLPTDSNTSATDPPVSKPVPRIILLDEATSSVDTETESQIHASLIARLRATRCTVFIIAHRLSTVVGADEIFVLGEADPDAQTERNGAGVASAHGRNQNGAAKPPTDKSQAQHSESNLNKPNRKSINEEKEPVTSNTTQNPGTTIIERGTHASLISKPEGRYKRLWEKQMASLPTGMAGNMEKEEGEE